MAARQALAPAGRRFRPRRLLIGALVLVIIGAAATLFGVDLGSWLKQVWDTVTGISLGYLVAAIVLITIQTTATAYSWYAILRFAYPDGQLGWDQALACYAASVALNLVLPASLGTLVMMLMFTTIIVGATFAGVLGGYVIQKIFYSMVGTACYVYLFLSVDGTFALQLGFVEEHPWATVILLAAAILLLVLIARVIKPRLVQWWSQAKEGGQILAHPRAYMARVLLPEAISWVAMVGVIAVFLSAYNIPVSFHTLMRVVAGNSMAHMTSVTPGGAGVVQGFNVLALKGITSSANATAYSVAQQLVTTAWSILFAIVLMVRAFGWTQGRALVQESYSEAKERSHEQSEARRARRRARGGGVAREGEPAPPLDG